MSRVQLYIYVSRTAQWLSQGYPFVCEIISMQLCRRHHGKTTWMHVVREYYFRILWWNPYRSPKILQGPGGYGIVQVNFSSTNRKWDSNQISPSTNQQIEILCTCLLRRGGTKISTKKRKTKTITFYCYKNKILVSLFHKSL